MDADKITILVAEDDKDVKTLIEKELTSLGYITIVASSFLESKNLILNQGNKVDLFLVDIQLPDGDGFHLIQDIRQINWNVFDLRSIPKTTTATNARATFLSGPFKIDTLP